MTNGKDNCYITESFFINKRLDLLCTNYLFFLLFKIRIVKKKKKKKNHGMSQQKTSKNNKLYCGFSVMISITDLLNLKNVF